MVLKYMIGSTEPRPPISSVYSTNWASLVAHRLKRLPAMWETSVLSLGWEDPLEKEIATTPVFLPGESHGRRSLVGYSPRGRKESDTTERLQFHFHGTNLRVLH